MSNLKMNMKRFITDIKDLNKSIRDPKSEILSENGKDIEPVTDFVIILRGPPDTPYSGGLFKVKIIINSEHPHKPPKITFETPIYHPNINNSGIICLDTLKDGWSPALSLEKVMLTISALLQNPNPDDPLSPEISNEYKTNKKIFYLNAIAHTKKYASKDTGRDYMVLS